MKTSIKTYLTVIGLLVLAACKVSKDISTPADIAPAAYRNVTTTDTATIATISWQQFFTDPTLQQLIDSTITHNYDMQAAIKNIEAAQLVLKQSKLGYLPEASLQVTGAISRPSDNSLNGLSLSKFLGKSYVEDYSLSVGVSWEADIWGKIRNRQARALAEYLQTVEAKKAIQTDLVAAVATGYYNLLMLDAQIDIAKKNVLLNDSTISIIRLQYNAGQVTGLAIQQATAQRLLAVQLVPQLEQEIILQENALSVLAGVPPAATARNGNLYDVTLSTDARAGVPASLLQNRPDVRAKELALTVANANTGIAKANMYPTLAITVEGGINSFMASNWFNLPASLFAAAAGSVVQPLFKRGELKTNYQLSEIEREKSVIEFRQTVLVAVGEVSDALAKSDKLQAQQSVAGERVDTLQQATGNAALLFKNGMADYLEVIIAQRNVLLAELDLALLKKEQLGASIDLYRSLGGGWK